MPVSLSPISRRHFLKGSLLAGAGCWAGRVWGKDTQAFDPHRFALLADTHIHADPKKVVRGTNMFENLKQISRQIMDLKKLPSGVLIDGDCAFNAGTTEDYQVFLELLVPLRKVAIPVHLALGNHDHRERFWEAASVPEEQKQILEQKHVGLIESERVNFIILDSLMKTNQTPGILGVQQLKWLEQILDLHPEKPSILLMHHNPSEAEQTSGLTDTRALYEVIKPRKQVKALVFGHTHHWHLNELEGIHLVNLPPVGYVFQPGQPYGWVDAELKPDGAILKLNCLDTKHKQHGETVKLSWRS